jgi:hypothetical protein
MALLVRKMGKFMKKKSYGARKRRDHNKKYVRRCYKCKSMDHVVVDCPYNSDNDEDEKKKHKKEKKEKETKEKKMTFTKKKKKKKKRSSYVVIWDSDDTSDDNNGSSDDDKKSIKKALASIAINNKHSLFDTPLTCLMVQASLSTTSISSSTCLMAKPIPR